jgi:hypothetical protein
MHPDYEKNAAAAPERPAHGGGVWVGMTWRALRRELALVIEEERSPQLAMF